MNEQNITDEKAAVVLEPLSDILLVLDKIKNRIEAVKGVDKDGNLETVAPQKKNEIDFMRVDKNGDVFSNFFSNFWRKLNNPSGYKFLKISNIDMESVAKKLQTAIDHPTPEGNKLLDALEVKHNNTLKKENMETKQEVNQEQAKNDNKPEYRYNANEIDWDTAHKFGLNKELLEKNGQLEKLLKGYKSDTIFRIEGNFDGVVLKGDARLSLRQSDNKIVILTHGIRHKAPLDTPFYGHTFSKEDKENLLKTGNMGRVGELTNYQDGTKVKVLISLDKYTKEPVSYPLEWIKINDKFGGVKLNKEQKQDLMEGKAVLVEGITNKTTGELFSQMLQFSADDRKLVFAGNREALNNEQQVSREIPTDFRERQLTEKEQGLLKEGKAVYLEDLVNRDGNKLYSGYVFYNEQERKLDFSFRKPELNNQLEQVANDGAQKPRQTPTKNDPAKASTRNTVTTNSPQKKTPSKGPKIH
ncbi:DUF3945 domain-containing protein [Sphingobacterium sp. SRCM116780]|uniref:DUF4099 domain-containing protein n=1 Tax=Sphingobacterium sp. SRCM116780 TaxID=2907623 RepID=UPI001F282203|nr:DUF4099 domain-containing protein [Sphingobacterium sp. SRCM116780]UIR57857.1 DUF3945 domain-containing protein [Sphingobacterium sp. SRCM116780]